MSEELHEPAVEPATETADVGGDVPAVADAPGASIFICPACGNRYDDATTCANGHAPTETVEYDRETVAAADSGDAAAVDSIRETALAASGNTAGVTPTEATPAAMPLPDPAPAPAAPAAPATAAAPAAPAAPAPAVSTTATPDGIGGTPASAMTPDGVHPNVAAIGAALADLEGSIRAARTALGLG